MSTLGQKARSAVIWNVGFSMYRDCLQFAVMLVLVRLLTASDYGQYGLVVSITAFLGVVSIDSFLAHVLQVRQDEEVNYQLHFTAGGVIQLTLFVLANLIAVALRWSDKYAEVTTFLHVSSVIFILSWPSSFRGKMLERDLDWKRLRVLQAVSLLGASVLSIGAAALGAGVYALLIPPALKHIIFIYDLLAAKGWRPTWEWDAKQYAPAWHFGLSRVATGILNTGQQLVESTLLIQFVGFASYGYYGRAVGLAQIVCTKFSIILMQAIYPVLTRIEPGTDSHGRANGLVLRSVTWVVVPVAVVISALGDPLIRIVYGEKWLAVIPLLPWAMAEAALVAVAYAAYMLLLASQRQRLCLMSDAWVLAGTAASILLLVPLGLKYYLMGLIAVQCVTLALILFWLYRQRAASIPGVVSALAWPSVASACALLFCEGATRLAGADLSKWAVVAAYGVCFVTAYVGILRLMFGAQLGELVRHFPYGGRLSRLLLLPQSRLAAQ